MKTRTTIGKCPNCCPESGAEFEEWGSTAKRCLNCRLVMPVRRVRPSGKPTRSQEQAIERVLEVFGGAVVEQHMIGRQVWVEIRNDARHWMLGDVIYGSIGPRGRLDLKLPRFGAGDAVIRDDIAVQVYLGR